MPKKPKVCHWCGQPATVRLKKQDLTVNACELCAQAQTRSQFGGPDGRRLFSWEPQGWTRGKKT
jgi:hypothetical protein